MNQNGSARSPWIVPQGIVALLAGLSVVLTLFTAARYSAPSAVEDWFWRVQLVFAAGALYGSTMTAVHGRWGTILNHGGRVSLGVGLAVAAGHLLALMGVVIAALRQWDSRALLARLDVNFSAWVAVAGMGLIVSLLSLPRRNGASMDIDDAGPSLSGWLHALPPLLVGAALAAAVYWLESLPLSQ